MIIAFSGTQVLSSPGTFFTSTLEPSTPMQANLTTITANTTSAKPEDEGDDDEGAFQRGFNLHNRISFKDIHPMF